MAYPIKVMDSLNMSPFAGMLPGKGEGAAVQAVNAGILKNIMSALKKLSEENMELKQTVKRMEQDALQKPVRATYTNFPEKVSQTVVVDSRRQKGWMPVD